MTLGSSGDQAGEAHSYESFWNDRSRYKQSPPRYAEVASIPQVAKLLRETGKTWSRKGSPVNYLDLGCGGGVGALGFADFVQKETGLDVNAMGIDASAECEEACRSHGLQFSRLDIGSQRIPYRERFQIITVFETIEHVFDTDFLVTSIRESLSDDGLLFVTTLNVVSWKNRILVPLGIQPINTEVSTKRLGYGFKIKFLKDRIDTWPPAGHIRPFTLFSLQDILQDNGFTLISSHGIENWKALRFLELVAKNMCTAILVIARRKSAN